MAKFWWVEDSAFDNEDDRRVRGFCTFEEQQEKTELLRKKLSKMRQDKNAQEKDIRSLEQELFYEDQVLHYFWGDNLAAQSKTDPKSRNEILRGITYGIGKVKKMETALENWWKMKVYYPEKTFEGMLEERRRKIEDVRAQMTRMCSVCPTRENCPINCSEKMLLNALTNTKDRRSVRGKVERDLEKGNFRDCKVLLPNIWEIDTYGEKACF